MLEKLTANTSDFAGVYVRFPRGNGKYVQFDILQVNRC